MSEHFSLTLFAIALSTGTLAMAGDGAAGMSGMAGMAGMAGMVGTNLPSRYGTQKVGYHINSYGAKGQTAALRNIQNYVNVSADYRRLRLL